MRNESRLSAALIVAAVVLATLAGYRWLNAPPPAASVRATARDERPSNSRVLHQPTILQAAPDSGPIAAGEPGSSPRPAAGFRLEPQRASRGLDSGILPFVPIPIAEPPPLH